jgi:hypothetical protein
MRSSKVAECGALNQFMTVQSCSVPRPSYADAVGLAVAHARAISDAVTLDQAWAACGVTPIA